MIELKALSFGYRGRTPLFERFSLRIPRGEAWAVIGPSGCGKSTLLHLLAGLSVPVSGEIRINGARLERPRPRTGLVLQDHGLLPWATVWKNARLGWRIRAFYGPDERHTPTDASTDTKDAEEHVVYWLERLSIAHLRDRYPHQLSRGQRQRTAIARTMALEPDLLLLDEPFSALDAPTREGLQRLVLELNRERGLTIVLVTHDIVEAALMGETILALSDEINHRPQILANPCQGDFGFEKRTPFPATCERLRRMLGPGAEPWTPPFDGRQP